MKWLTLTAALLLAGCITYTPETARIHVVYRVAQVDGCTPLGAVQDPSILHAVSASFIGSGRGFTAVLNQAAALHADTVLVTNVQMVAGTAYRCGRGT